VTLDAVLRRVRLGAQDRRRYRVSDEKLDDVPGVFTVKRHVRGKWVCACCQKLMQAPVGPKNGPNSTAQADRSPHGRTELHRFHDQP
jgi:hypothetical protein